MRIIHLSHSDTNGGAARAAYRLHSCLREAAIDSQMWVNQASGGDWTVQGPLNKWEKISAGLRGSICGQLKHIFKTDNPIIHSPAIIPSNWVKRINESDADIVHLHWIGFEMLSIADIGRIQKPIVWTLHDMWFFCGAEHYTDDFRWRDGYFNFNRPHHEHGFDVNRWSWNRKRKHWQQPMHIVTPSQWLAHCVQTSALIRDWPLSIVPNPIDTKHWKPLEQQSARALLGLPANAPLLLFGAMDGGQDQRKGFDLLLLALKHLKDHTNVQDLELVIFGQHSPQHPPALGYPIHYLGFLQDDLSLRAAYSAADALVIPSRQDNLPNTAIEANACGTPVIAFKIGGLPDIVAHKKTGYLANTFDIQDMINGIIWVLQSRKEGQLGANARESAVEQFDNAVIAERYLQIYKKQLGLTKS